MTATIFLGTSFLFLFVLFLFKFFEIRREFSFYSRIRTLVDQRVEDVSTSLLSLPDASKTALARIVHIFICWVSETTLYAVRFLEKKLLKFVNMVKGKGDIKREKDSASLFLKKISSDKKSNITFDKQ